MYKQLTFGSDARARMFEGVEILAKAVRTTLGPRGRNVVINRPNGPFATKDGVTVAQEIRFNDPWLDMGAQMVKEVASLSNRQAGDGTTTATVLAAAILREGLEAIKEATDDGKVADSVALKRGIDMCVQLLIEEMGKFVVPCDTDAALRHVALISANGDEVIADLIIEAMRRTNYGLVIVEEGVRQTDELAITSGLEFDRGFYNIYFTNPGEGEPSWNYEKVNVLLYDGKVETPEEVVNVLELFNSRPTLLVAREFSDAVIGMIVANNQRGCKLCPLRAPGFGEETIRHLSDIAMISRARILADSELTHKPTLADAVGMLERVTVRQATTTLVAEPRDDDDYNNYLEAIRKQLEIYRDEDNQFMLDRFGRRLAQMSGGLGFIRVGGQSEFSMRERRDRIIDALSAVNAARAEGIHPGGGYPLMRAAAVVRTRLDAIGSQLDPRANPEGVIRGFKVLLAACVVPLHSILANAGNEVIAEDQTWAAAEKTEWTPEEWSFGFNAAACVEEDLIKGGVIDPFKVTRRALINASDVAGLMLTTECMITDDKTGTVGVESFTMGH